MSRDIAALKTRTNVLSDEIARLNVKMGIVGTTYNDLKNGFYTPKGD